MNRREHHDLMGAMLESGLHIDKLNTLKTEMTGISGYPKTHEAHGVFLECLEKLTASFESFRDAARQEIRITEP